MSASLSVIAAADAAPSCAADATTLCARVWELTGSAWLAGNAGTLVETPARILLVLLVAVVTRLLLHRGIRRLTDRTATGAVPTVLRPLRSRVAAARRDGGEQLVARRTQRAEAIGSVLRSFSSFVVLGIAVVLVLGELGIDLAPIVASAGVLGVALGFGAQNLVKDFIAGIGIILEDQYGVGDVVDLGQATGTVEAVGLRITRLRDAHGVVWYVRNGEILRVGNKSQGYAQVVVDLPVAHDTDLERARTVLVYQRTDSPLLSALTFALGYLPWLLGGPVLAALADRLPRHRVLVGSDAARAVVIAVMVVPGLPLPVLLVLLFLVSLGAPPFESARTALQADV